MMKGQVKEGTFAVIGSRKYKNKDLVKQVILDYIPQGMLVISGKCPKKDSVDNWAIAFAKIAGWETDEFPPKEDFDAEKFENKFFARNFEIAENADVILAFVPRGQVRSGVRNAIRYFRELGKTDYYIFDEDGKIWDWHWAVEDIMK